jgi:hypothetical protein
MESTERVTDHPAYPNGVDCDVWRFDYGTAVADKAGHANMTLPDAGGYVGEYLFYSFERDRPAEEGGGRETVPVRFRLDGHNVVLGGSHSDDYRLDYLSFRAVPQDASHFKKPVGMPCHPMDAPFGPTERNEHKRWHHPAHSLLALMPGPEADAHRAALFSQFVAEHKEDSVLGPGSAAGPGADRAMRARLFHRSYRYVHAANRRGRTFHLRLNRFADWTEEERRAILNDGAFARAAQNPAVGADPLPCTVHTSSNATVPGTFDWRAKGAVNKPKDQGTCGSCWSYGLTGTVEGAWQIAGHPLPKLSQQNVMDCSWGFNNTACDGGLDYLGARWLLAHNDGKLATARSYGGYRNQDGFCHYDLKLNLTADFDTGEKPIAGAQISGCVHVTKDWNATTTTLSPTEAVAALNDAVQGRPLSVSVDAGPGCPGCEQDFYFYGGGRFYDPNCGNEPSDLDHTVLMAGYKTYVTLGDPTKYNIVRNSWGESWGDKGYIYISQQDNNCGVATQAFYVEV